MKIEECFQPLRINNQGIEDDQCCLTRICTLVCDCFSRCLEFLCCGFCSETASLNNREIDPVEPQLTDFQQTFLENTQSLDKEGPTNLALCLNYINENSEAILAKTHLNYDRISARFPQAFHPIIANYQEKNAPFIKAIQQLQENCRRRCEQTGDVTLRKKCQEATRVAIEYPQTFIQQNLIAFQNEITLASLNYQS
jgi:hypothetical protein